MTWQIWRFEGEAFTDFKDYGKAVRKAISRDLECSGQEPAHDSKAVKRNLVSIDRKPAPRGQDDAATIPLPTPSLVLIAMATTQQVSAVKIIKKEESIFSYGNKQKSIHQARKRKGSAWKDGRATQKLHVAKRYR